MRQASACSSYVGESSCSKASWWLISPQVDRKKVKWCRNQAGYQILKGFICC
jgi:hypothetical protein